MALSGYPGILAAPPLVSGQEVVDRRRSRPVPTHDLLLELVDDAMDLMPLGRHLTLDTAELLDELEEFRI
jgi:hypothetical protein